MAAPPLTARLLVVDGPRHRAPAVAARLSASGADVTTCDGPDDVHLALQREPYDVVVLELPAAGADAVHAVVGAAPGSDLVVLGGPEADVRHAVLRAGALECVPEVADVEAVVRAAVGRRSALATARPARRGGPAAETAGALGLAAAAAFLPAALVAALCSLLAVGLLRARRRAVRSETILASAAEQIGAGRRRHRMLATLAPVGILETDASGACTYVNPRWCELTGLAPRQAWGDGWTAALHPDDRERVFGAWARAVATGRELQVEHRLVRHDGSATWASLSSVPVLDGDGVLVGHLATLTDVHALKAAEQASEDARSQLAAMVDHWPGVAYLQDAAGRFLMANPAAARLTAGGEVVGRTPEELLSVDYAAEMRVRDARVLAGEVVRYEPTLPDADGTPRSFLSTKFPVRDAAGDVVALGSLSIDITERRRVEAALRDAEERFRQAFEDAPIGMALFTPQGRFAQVNQALTELTGHPEDVLLGTSWQTLVHPDELDQDEAAIVAMLDGRLRTYHREGRLLHASGDPVWVSVHVTLVRGADGSPRHLLAQVQDITERRRFEGRLQHMADHDPLTGLLNRRRFEEELDRQVATVERYGARGALLVLDLDHFKVVNDTLGHNAGDELIVSVADVLRRRLRATDVIARLGGDEFAVLLPEADVADAERVGAELVDEIRRHATVLNGERPRRVTASLGIALFEPPLHAGEEVLVNADLAMYDAKEAGRDTHVLFASDRYAEPRMKSRLAWVERIRHALEDDRFVLEAQPIRDLRTGETVQCELLLRMLGEDGDLIPPGAFLHVAERYDLIQAIDRWVASRAIELLHEHPDLVFEVNVSGKSLNDPLLLETVETGLQISGVDPRRLIFEVTETAAVANIHQARDFADRLAALGCRFALDDFGAGFGSFYYLKHLPFDYLKIDGEFISNCLRSRTDRLVIEAVVGIARGLGKATIAEFVGDERTERFLRGHGVDMAQGFHVGEPVPLHELARR